MTTPNPLNPLRFISLLFGGAAHANAEHTCWFTEQVLCQLMARHSFEPVEVRYADDSYQYYRTLKWAPFLPLNRALVRMRPRFSETICAAFTVTA